MPTKNYNTLLGNLGAVTFFINDLVVNDRIDLIEKLFKAIEPIQQEFIDSCNETIGEHASKEIEKTLDESLNG